jgi:hypothetical protein
MKSLLLIAVLALAGCATNGQPQSPSVQAQWYAACKGWSAAQPQVAMKMLTAPVSQVQIALPITQSISKSCEAPMPADSIAAVTTLTGNITQVLIVLGLQQVTQGVAK